MIVVLLADGFEEIEALTPVDMLRRAGLDVKTVGINSKIAAGSHKIPVICDIEPHEVELDKVSTVIFPGGMPGSLNLDASPFTDKIIAAVKENSGRIAAICAAPLILGRRGLLNGKKATCYPGFENELSGAEVVDASVVTDGNITTARGMGAALEFASELVSLICGEEKKKALCDSIMEDK
jgi:4-methyl-5(b-hydroxyethyl)-thiazole monophosphate biosynthesis